MVQYLGQVGPTPAYVLQQTQGISAATLKRYIKDARLLGAEIESYRSGQTWAYRLINLDQITARLDTWIELEQKRDLTA